MEFIEGLSYLTVGKVLVTFGTLTLAITAIYYVYESGRKEKELRDLYEDIADEGYGVFTPHDPVEALTPPPFKKKTAKKKTVKKKVAKKKKK